MNLSEPLEGLTSRVGASVLRILARADAGFSGRQVHALAAVGSTSSVHRALTSLVDVGIVTSVPQPPAIVYRINRDHALWPAVHAALESRTRVFERVAAFCVEELPEDLDLSVVVYGSVARRESTLESDVDLFIVYPDGIDPESRSDYDYQIANYVSGVTGNEAQIFSVEREDFLQRREDGDRLVANVLEDGILIHGPEISYTSRLKV